MKLLLKNPKKRKEDEEQQYWLSYSDMMAGLLLCFVLIIALTTLHSKILYDEKQDELAGKEQELILRSDELENEKLTVAEQGAKLNAQELKLTEQEGKLAEQAGKLELQRKQLLEQEQKLLDQSALLADLEDLMTSQQEELDRIIGVRTELVEALKTEFESSDLEIAVDEATGAITLDSSILFEYNMDELKEGGQDFLAAFMPRYMKILLSDEYSPYVSEVIIEGHTDTSGTYLFNLDLSQKRAYQVANYCLSADSNFLSEEERKNLSEVLTVSGRSYSDPIRKADGSIDADASRRVEINFRLKDEEMISEMMKILNEGYETEEDLENSIEILSEIPVLTP